MTKVWQKNRKRSLVCVILYLIVFHVLILEKYYSSSFVCLPLFLFSWLERQELFVIEENMNEIYFEIALSSYFPVTLLYFPYVAWICYSSIFSSTSCNFPFIWKYWVLVYPKFLKQSVAALWPIFGHIRWKGYLTVP